LLLLGFNSSLPQLVWDLKALLLLLLLLLLEVEVGMVQAAIQVTGCLKSEDKESWIMRCLLIETKMHFS